MAGPLLSRDKQTSRRRWFIVAAVFTLVLLLFTVSSRYRSSASHVLEHPSSSSSSSSSQSLSHTAQPAEHVSSQPDPPKAVSTPQFTKPKDVPIVGFIFFGRKSRVEILRCYIEVRLRPHTWHQTPMTNLSSATWSTMVGGSTKSTGYEIQRRLKT